MESVTVLGSTGSIGLSTLDVIARHPERYEVFALTCQRSLDTLRKQVSQFKPRYVVASDEQAADALAKEYAGGDITVLSGVEGLCEVAAHPDCDVVMAAIVGAAGLEPTLAAVRAGKRVLLANKESLVMAGHLFMNAVREHGATLLPIDSEHNAIFQCMPADFQQGATMKGVRRILLTASGGPFRTQSAADLQAVTPDQACAHPNWSMGRKISVDSATLMNKGLELIEACWLFDCQPDLVEVVVHPQSIIHSMVEYTDGSVLAQLGNPDMRTPIAYGLAWPERIDAGVSALDIIQTARLDFEAPDMDRFPCLRLAFEAAAAGGTASAVLNAANEVAVQAFLDEKIGFLDIAAVNEQVLADSKFSEPTSIDVVKDADRDARAMALEAVTGRIARV